MQRRGFLQALMGAAAGLAGAKVIASQSPSRGSAPLLDIPLPCPATKTPITAATSPSEAQATVAEMLKDCRVINVSRTSLVAGGQIVNVTYRHAPKAARTSLDAEVAGSRMKPRSVAVSSVQGEFDLEIEVEWIG